jgi:hypothetical protein
MSAEIIPFPSPQSAQTSRDVRSPGVPKPATAELDTLNLDISIGAPGPAGLGPAAPRSAGEDRLRRALAALEAAVTGQRAAVAEWRRSLQQLGTTMNGLGSSLGRYRDSLTNLEGQVGSLNGQAVALEQWADKVLTAEQG